MAATSNSTFMFDTQAWTSMANRVANLSNTAMQGHEAAVLSSQTEGMAKSAQPQHVGESNANESTAGEKGSAGSEKTTATDSTSADDNVCPPSPMTRTKSSPSLASVLRQSAFELRKSTTTPRRTKSNRSVGTVGSAGESVATAEGGGAEGSSARARRPTRSRSFVVRKSNRTSGDEQQLVKCDIHPQVRMRSNRCPLCAAGEMKKLRRKSFGGGGSSSPSIVDDANDEGSNGSVANGDEVEEVSLDPKWANALRGKENIGMINNEDDDEEDEEIEEVSLDPKWAEALRGISMRLASERALQTDEEGEEQQSGGEDNSPEDAPEVDTNVDARGKEESEPSMPQHKTLSHLTELQQTIMQATKSIGKFHVDDGDEEDEQEEEEESVFDDDDDISKSSFGRDTPLNKTFAESKALPLLPQHGTQPHHEHGTPLSRDLRQLNVTKFALPEVNADIDSRSVGSDDSSVTMSVASGYTLESYNSLRAPPGAPHYAASRANAHYSSPKSVLDRKLKSLYPKHREEDEDEEEEAEEEEENVQDFESSFYMSAPKDYSEKKATTSSIPTNPKQVRGNEQVIVEDVSDESDIDDEGTVQAPAPPAPQAASPPAPSSKKVAAESPASTRPTAKPRRSSLFSAKSRARSKSRPRDKSQQRSHRSKSRPRNDKTSEEGRQSNGVDVSGRTTKPSFFSALVHNSRARSKSRGPRSSRSKSRTRHDVETAKGARTSRRKSKPNINNDNARQRQGTEEQVEPAPPQPKQKALPQATEKRRPHSSSKPTAEPEPEASQTSEEPSQSSSIPDDVYSVERGPITHPFYKLGDQARDEDVIVFPKHKSRHGRSRRRGRHKSKSRGHSTDSSSSDDSSDDENGRRTKYMSKADIALAIGQLRHLDAAFVRRSDDSWTYAIVADGNDDEIRFVVNPNGSTKSFPKSLWKSCVRRIRVLTQREGDRMAINSSKPNRRKRSIGRSRSFRAKGKAKGRFVSPSPTRRNVGVLNLPPTIREDKVYNQ